MKIAEYKGKTTKNNPSQFQNVTTERKINDPPSQTQTELPRESGICSKKNWKCILIISIILSIIVAGAITLIIVLLRNNDKDKDKDDNEVPIPPSTPEETFPPGLDLGIVKDVFSPSFKVISKEKTLTQLSQKSFQIYETTTDGQKSSYTILNKALLDIYTINSTSALNFEKNLFTTKYTTVISVNSFCSKLTSDPENDDCSLEKILDLNKVEDNNLRRNEEIDEDLVRRAILPICLAEHTDTNIVISFNCPETLADSFKADIVRAFGNVKPGTMKGHEFDKDYVDTKTEEKDDKIYINSYDNVCLWPSYDPTKTVICNVSKDIITDKEGLLISSKITNSTQTIQDENNFIKNKFIYEFKNIPKENSDSFNEEIYKKNLDSILLITKNLMKKEYLINNFTELAINITSTDQEEESSDTNLRDLMEKEAQSSGIYEENIFNKTISSISMNLNLKNDIGLSEGQSAKASSVHNVNNENYNELSINRIQTNLNETLNKFISLSNSAKKLTYELKENFNDPLLNFMNIITDNIEKINNFLANKDLSEIFDSTLAINELTSLPYDFVAATEHLFNTMNDLGTNLLYTIDNAKKKLKEDISKFLADSHNLLFKLFDNLSELSETLSSDKSKIVGVSTYYLNNTDSSYYEMIQQAKNILDNYYKNEKNLIQPLVNTVLESFYTNTKNGMEKYQSMLDSISDRLNDGNIIITLAKEEDYQKAISNIYNTKIKANEIIDSVKENFEAIINPYSNGYFESQKEIDDNNKSYGPIGDRAVTIAYDLDNNGLIDKHFDNSMTNFRDKYLELLKNMENSIKDKFPLEEDVLSTTSFDATYLNGIDEYLKNEKINILNLIKNENDEYLKSVNDILSSFKNENGNTLDQIMNDLIKEIDDFNMDNLNTVYSDSLELTFKKIEEIITYNENLGNQYLTNVKNANSYHITKGFINKYNTFVKSIQNINNFINKDLKNNLANKYKNVITQISSLLQSIKSNQILEKYYKQLPSAESHLNSINDLFIIFQRYISDNTFNMRYLPLINNFIKNTNENLNNIKTNFKVIYDALASKKQVNNLEDYDVQKQKEGPRYCCRRFIWCTKHCRDTITYYDYYNVIGTDNHLSLKSINFQEYIKQFDDKYKNIYNVFSKNVLSYNSLLSKLDLEIDNETKKDSFKQKIIYLDNISQKVKSIIEEKLGNNLLTASYNYYKNKITATLPNELTDIIEQWKNAYDEIYNEIDLSKDNFKSCFYEFFVLSSFYIQTYRENISYNYGETIVDKLKNEFNYTNRYYYNIIISKINNTYSYILDNLPSNEKPFDTILNRRISEISISKNNILNELLNSQKEILDKNKQEVTLQVNSKNFFYINDMIKDHIKYFNETLTEKVNNLMVLAYQTPKDNPEELIAAKFYLENSINGKQIKENYDMINKATFIDLQTDVYQKLIDDIWKIDRDELIKNIINTLAKSNETNNNRFKYENMKYMEILQNKLYEEFYTNDELIAKIFSFFLNGINNCKENSKTEIDGFLNVVLNKVKTHLTNEATRLDNELTSYSNVFTDIKNRLKNYKNEIYDQFYSTITYVVNDFNENILEKFYKNFIEKGINEYETNIGKTNFGTAQFLNMSINLNEIINKEFNLLITEYKNLTLNQIKYQYQKNIQSLDKLFNFTQMKLKINNEIDTVYNSKLLPILQKVGKFKSGDEGVSNYDLPESILTDINNSIKGQVTKTKNLIKEMEGKEYIINDFTPADFSAGKDNIYDQITKMFTNFTLSYTSQEKKEFDKIVGENAVNNFKTLMNNFIPSFGVDFFDRILRFNEIQKIHMLYSNLKYSLAQTILYYIGLVSINDGIHLPLDIKLKLYTLNNLDSIVKEKNDFILSTLNDKLEGYFEETKNYIVNKYINDMNTNEEFDLKFNANLKDIIKGIISGNIHNYENNYINMMKDNIKAPFISDYTKALNEATQDMKYFVEDTKIQMKVELDKIFSTDSDSVSADIQIKFNNTKTALETYNEHFTTFKISEEVIDFLDNFGEKNIFNKYNPIKELLDKRTAELVIINLEKLSNEFREEYSIESFQEEINTANKNLSSYFDDFTNILNNYGSIEDTYKRNLDKEIANYRRIRLLEEGDSTEENKIADVKLDITFSELKNSSLLVKEFIQSLNLFNTFEDNIKKYISDKNKEYSLSEYNLEKNKDKNENYDLMIETLEELNQLSSEYYNQAQNVYNLMKEQIINNIIQINELINSCEKVTYEIINNKYIEIKDKFNKIEQSNNLVKNKINISPYKSQQTDNYFTVETNVENYLIDNKFTLDIIFEGESKTPKVIGKVVNNILPKIFDINFYSSTGQNGKLGRRINVVFNNISSYTNIVFDAGLNQANIITNFNFDEYSVKTQYYQEKVESVTKIIMGMTIIIPGVPTIVDIETPMEEKFKAIPAKNKTLIDNFIY